MSPDGESLNKKREDLVNNIENIENIEQQLIELRAILDREAATENSAQYFDEEPDWIKEAKETYIKKIKGKIERLEEFLNIQTSKN